ncbi:MAG: preprotein translocase subunit SecE [Candidatus Kerfeldbacteria bacterium RIFCSPLOWO2_01_FULL_48_11]|uniref:Protein translocase subunit SecE n=1 Tax=Candidatus Kerfeldbacteria bacterium RIFCSPLOWO2_01_FULL_48_11 TaxID=1798543 RepID=A0A1G2B2L0_9BACT|nr:MAG: Preprotein translocase subunit SecE [Parcubacteria group bacterium GW2011_GWA2_48_9]KKW15656.1 MAG: Preprotein translocase subunit SecE [Parcubacteria group bacterium GW2011_GWC2_49_9]OGY82909.1 MAG: preprotein translocase subunit SecE [Candidatus Kerfeldbacteria bacterium RIFCSPLOWO2_01_FULL_48_11]HCJ52852.1 preprotein translocase subunit SecE [Candidatus Kerfeldbacteria bacterium]HCM67713.1 preprotein translocase subunit SecE [Candidatus Kerfeldbacteria bacterium]
MAFNIAQYIRESRDELRKVLWPSRKETLRHTLLVIGVSLGVAIFLGIADFLLNFAVARFLA